MGFGDEHHQTGTMYLPNCGMPQVAHTHCLLTDDSTPKWEFGYHRYGHVTLIQVSHQATPRFFYVLQLGKTVRWKTENPAVGERLPVRCSCISAIYIQYQSHPCPTHTHLTQCTHGLPLPIFRFCPLSCRHISVMPTALIAISQEFLIMSHAKETLSL